MLQLQNIENCLLKIKHLKMKMVKFYSNWKRNIQIEKNVEMGLT